MKKFMPPLLCLVLCCILLLSCVQLALGAELEPEPVHCFRSKPEGKSMVLYQAPVPLELAGEEGAAVLRRPELYSLDDVKDPESFLWAYPLYSQWEPRPDTAYRRVDLEDSLDAAAQRLRAVVLGSYPARDIHSLQLAADGWLQGEKLPRLTSLQTGEAVLATQAAIWTLTGSEVGLPSQEALEGNTAFSAQNIQSLYAYLMALPPEEARYDTVSEDSMTGADMTLTLEDDGTYALVLSLRVDTTVSGADSVTLTAVCGGQRQSQLVTGAGEYRFTFRDAVEASEAVLELSGLQYSSDVSVFLPQDPGAPALVGHHSGTHPVYARKTVSLVQEETTETTEE